MWIVRKRIQHFFLSIANLGIDGKVPSEDARIIRTQNFLSISSAILLSPFPLTFILLGLYEGLYLCALSSLAVIIPLVLIYFQYFFWARFVGITMGMLGFVLGVVFYGYSAGFQFGIVAMLALPTIYFQQTRQKIAVTGINSLLVIGVLGLSQEFTPLFDAGESVIILQLVLLFSCTLLIVSYFLSLDWIHQIYRKDNHELVEKLTLRNEELKNFSYSTSHDLKQPLQTILSFLSLFHQKKGDQLDEEGVIYLNFIQDAGTRLNLLIDALLAHSVLGQTENFEVTDCQQLVLDVRSDLKDLIQKSKGQLFIDYLPSVVGNKVELHSVFQNLISNALKFSKEGSYPIIRIGAREEGKYWKFHVQDNGVGIEEHLKEKIFQMFQKGHTNRSINGTGIGLANCKKIINLHGGDIWVESEYGKGSSFYFTLKKMPSKD